MMGIGFGKRAGNGSRGFTLIELMVVMGLIVIMGIVASSFSSTGWLAHARLKGAASDLHSAMQKARMNAIKGNRTWGVLFNTNAPGTYRLQCIADDGTWQDRGGNVSLSSYSTDVSFGYGPATVNVAGAAVGGGTAAITFADGSTAPATPAVSPQFRVTFDSKGMSNGGYCYLANTNGAYAVGTTIAGSVLSRRWNRNAFR